MLLFGTGREKGAETGCIDSWRELETRVVRECNLSEECHEYEERKILSSFDQMAIVFCYLTGDQCVTVCL